MTLKGVTDSGFEFEIEKEKTEDFRFLDLLSQVDETNPFASVKAIEFLLGKEQKDRLVEFCKNENGYSSVEKVMNVFSEIMISCKELKN